MSLLSRLAVSLFVAATVGSSAAAAIPEDPTALAESYFDESERFDAFITYENRRGPLRVLFTVARRWHDGLAELLFDVREPTDFRKVALLARQTRGGSDDLFAYLGGMTGMGDIANRRVRRLSAPDLEREAIYSVFALGDFRPFAKGELRYDAAPDAVVADTPCRVVIGRPVEGALGFDRVELAFAADTGLMLESRFFRDEREVRRISISPDAYEVHDGRRLPMRRIARSFPDSGETELLTRHVLATSDLPDELFSHKNLVAQRFPDF
jgi:hypothetical protein